MADGSPPTYRDTEFDPPTEAQLLKWLWRCVASPHPTGGPQAADACTNALPDFLPELLSGDSSFRHWLALKYQVLCNTPTANSQDSCDSLVAFAKPRLLELLADVESFDIQSSNGELGNSESLNSELFHGSSRGSSHGGGASSGCGTPQALRDAARTAIRLRLLQNSFDQTLHTAKLESLYQLAYGLSHEINNPLANIAARSQSLISREPQSDRKQALAIIADQAMRAHEMTVELMQFARPPKLRLQRLNLKELIDSVTRQLVSAKSMGSTKINTNIGNNIWLMADPTALKEVFAAVLRNSAEATAALTDGRIRITAAVSVDSVDIAVQDNGSGWTTESLRHACDPFYSSREAGRGLGFGLAKAYRLLELHHGRLQLPAAPNAGSGAGSSAGSTLVIRLSVSGGVSDDC